MVTVSEDIIVHEDDGGPEIRQQAQSGVGT